MKTNNQIYSELADLLLDLEHNRNIAYDKMYKAFQDTGDNSLLSYQREDAKKLCMMYGDELELIGETIKSINAALRPLKKLMK